jgi:hypothetical protein
MKTQAKVDRHEFRRALHDRFWVVDKMAFRWLAVMLFWALVADADPSHWSRSESSNFVVMVLEGLKEGCSKQTDFNGDTFCWGCSLICHYYCTTMSPKSQLIQNFCR